VPLTDDLRVKLRSVMVYHVNDPFAQMSLGWSV
jgi:hypothetical protein